MVLRIDILSWFSWSLKYWFPEAICLETQPTTTKKHLIERKYQSFANPSVICCLRISDQSALASMLLWKCVHNPCMVYPLLVKCCSSPWQYKRLKNRSKRYKEKEWYVFQIALLFLCHHSWDTLVVYLPLLFKHYSVALWRRYDCPLAKRLPCVFLIEVSINPKKFMWWQFSAADSML